LSNQSGFCRKPQLVTMHRINSGAVTTQEHLDLEWCYKFLVLMVETFWGIMHIWKKDLFSGVQISIKVYQGLHA